MVDIHPTSLLLLFLICLLVYLLVIVVVVLFLVGGWVSQSIGRLVGLVGCLFHGLKGLKFSGFDGVTLW